MSLVIVSQAGVAWCRPDGCSQSKFSFGSEYLNEIRRSRPCAVLLAGLTEPDPLELACRLRAQIGRDIRIGVLESVREISKSDDPGDIRLAGLCARFRSSFITESPAPPRRFTVDMPGRAIRNGHRTAACSPSEFRLMTFLLRYPDIVFSRQELLRRICGKPAVDPRMIDVFVHRLRQKIERDAAAPEHLVSVRGIGYSFQHNADVFIDILTGGPFLPWPCCSGSGAVTKS